MSVDKNHLIQMMPAQARARILSKCESVELTLSQVLYEAGTPTRYIYFPVRGFISLVVIVDDRSALEVGMVGSEGMLGVHVALGLNASPLRSLVQGPGVAWRMSASKFRTELSNHPQLQRGIHRYAAVLMSQMATSAACARYHLIKPRLARWLLMSQDRAHTDGFHVTQQFLSYMLGVRRVGVTVAAVALQNDGLIHYRRGDVEVIDRKGLEAAACSCYASDGAAYAMLAR
ncbi:MAG: Crp/Fnr family transcriptional regulator [Burkholderiaceae bacterium]